jgi:hypothetical protein
MTGDDHPDPDEADHHQSHADPAENLRIDREREQPMPIDGPVDDQGEDRGRKQSEDDAADDQAASRNQAETGDRGAGDGEQHRTPKVVLGCHGSLGFAFGWGVSAVPAPLLRWRGLA